MFVTRAHGYFKLFGMASFLRTLNNLFVLFVIHVDTIVKLHSFCFNCTLTGSCMDNSINQEADFIYPTRFELSVKCLLKGRVEHNVFLEC